MTEGRTPDQPLRRRLGETDQDLYARAALHAAIYGNVFVRLPCAEFTGVYGSCGVEDLDRVAVLGYN